LSTPDCKFWHANTTTLKLSIALMIACCCRRDRSCTDIYTEEEVEDDGVVVVVVVAPWFVVRVENLEMANWLVVMRVDGSLSAWSNPRSKASCNLMVGVGRRDIGGSVADDDDEDEDDIRGWEMLVCVWWWWWW
jgi:hypothetical protein